MLVFRLIIADDIRRNKFNTYRHLRSSYLYQSQWKWLVFKKYVIVEYLYIYRSIIILEKELHVLRS